MVSANGDGCAEEPATTANSAGDVSGALSMTEGSSMPIIDGSGACARLFNSCRC